MEFIVMIVQLVLIQKKELMVQMLVCPVLKEVQLGLLVHQAALLVLMDMCLLMDITVSKILLESNLNCNEVNLMFVQLLFHIYYQYLVPLLSTFI